MPIEPEFRRLTYNVIGVTIKYVLAYILIMLLAILIPFIPTAMEDYEKIPSHIRTLPDYTYGFMV